MDATGGMAQLNVRMDKTIRIAGTDALRSRGFTPAEFVRCIWRRLAQRGEGLDELVRIASQDEKNDVRHCTNEYPTDSSSHTKARCAGNALWHEFAQSIGLDERGIHSSYEELPYVLLLENARVEQYGIGAEDAEVVNAHE